MEIFKSRRISWAGHVWRAEGQTAHDSQCGNKTKNDREGDQDNSGLTELKKTSRSREQERGATNEGQGNMERCTGSDDEPTRPGISQKKINIYFAIRSSIKNMKTH